MSAHPIIDNSGLWTSAILEDVNPLAEKTRHHSDARTRVNRNLDLDPLIGTLDGANAWSLDLQKNAHLANRWLTINLWLPKADRVIIVDGCSHRLRAIHVLRVCSPIA